MSQCVNKSHCDYLGHTCRYSYGCPYRHTIPPEAETPPVSSSPVPPVELGEDGSVAVHELKTWMGQFMAIVDGSKRFEFRKNDRRFKEGDYLHLREWDPSAQSVANSVLAVSDDIHEGRYTGRSIRCRVTYFLSMGFGIPQGYCVMSISEPELIAGFDSPPPKHEPTQQPRSETSQPPQQGGEPEAATLTESDSEKTDEERCRQALEKELGTRGLAAKDMGHLSAKMRAYVFSAVNFFRQGFAAGWNARGEE